MTDFIPGPDDYHASTIAAGKVHEGYLVNRGVD